MGEPMNSDELKALFDRQAPNYDQQWQKMAPIRECLYLFLESIFAKLDSEARVLCVGAGTGKELIFLAQRFPRWQFTVVEPSGAMLEACRQAAQNAHFSARCHFHEGYLDSLDVGEKHDAATCFLVSQFILEPNERSAFFRQIADKLKPEGILVSSDLASDTASENYQQLLGLWLTLMSKSEISNEDVIRMREAYSRDVAILPPGKVASIIAAGGFEAPVQFYQAGLIHAFFAKRANTL